MAEQEIRILAKVAKSDGIVDEEERRLIYRIGIAYGMSQSDIDAIIAEENELDDFSSLNAEQRFNCIYNIIRVIKVDGQVLDDEIKYCMKITSKLGYHLRVVLELYSNIHPKVEMPSEKRKLRRIADQYLK